jgi:hypothetical protein
MSPYFLYRQNLEKIKSQRLILVLPAIQLQISFAKMVTESFPLFIATQSLPWRNLSFVKAERRKIPSKWPDPFFDPERKISVWKHRSG